jgi:predicted transcriptional regulator
VLNNKKRKGDEKMAKLKKPIPAFSSEEEEAEYWEKHSLLEHFDESDFVPLRVKVPKDKPITIRLDSASRQRLNEMAKAYRVGPSTLARAIISGILERWKENQQISMTLEDAAEALFQPIPEELKEEMLGLLDEGKAGNLYILNGSEMERISKLFVRYLVEAVGIKIKPDDEAYRLVSERLPATKTSASTRVRPSETTPSSVK